MPQVRREARGSLGADYTGKLEALYQHAASLAAAETLEEVSGATVEAMGRILGYDFISFLTVVNDSLLGVASKGAPLISVLVPIDGRGITARAARTGATQLVPDTRLDPDFFTGSTDSLSELAVPVSIEGRVVAVINAESLRVGAFGADDAALCELLASNVASAIQRIRNREKLTEAEAELRESEQLHRTILDNSPSPISITIRGKIVYANRSRLELTGASSLGEVVNQDGRSFVHPDDRSMIDARIRAYGNREKIPDRYEYRVAKPDGSFAVVEAISTPIVYHGESALLHILHDVTQSREYEERLASLHVYARDLAATETLDEAARVVGEVVHRWLVSSHGSVGYVEGDLLRFRYVYGVNWRVGGELPLVGRGITARAARTGETQLVRDVSRDLDYFLLESSDASTGSEVAVPVKVGGEVVAVVNVENPRVDAYNERDVRILEMLGSHFSSAIQRIRATERARLDEARMVALHGYAVAMSKTQSFDEAAKIIADAIVNLLKTSNGSLSMLENGALHFRYLYGVEYSEELVMPLDGSGITVRAARTGEPQLVPDVSKDPGYAKFFDSTGITRSELDVPIKVGGEVVAVINVESPELNAFSEGDQRLLEIFAGYMGSALARIRERAARESYRSRLESLNELVLQLDAAQTIGDTMGIASDLLQRLYKAEYDSIALIEGETLVSLKPGPGTTARLPLDGVGITVRAVKERRTVYVADTRSAPDYMRGEIDAGSELVVPLVVRGKAVGVLNLESTKREAYSEEDIRLAEALASHISSTLDRIRLVEEQRQALERALREEAAAQRARELAGIKTRFLSAATHEIRTPLTSINGYTNLIQDALKSGDTSTLQTYFEVVKRNAERLTRLTDDLLDTQRIEENQMRLNRAPTRLGELLGDVKREASPLVSPREQVLSISNSFDGVVEVDRDRLTQVIMNMVRNASKFSPTGSTINVSVEKSGDDILFSIRDHGVGLSKEDIPKLFRPFPGIRVEGNKEGTGLGLSICRGIVELHGGRIWAESRGVGKGSTFRFTIPLNAKTS